MISAHKFLVKIPTNLCCHGGVHEASGIFIFIYIKVVFIIVNTERIIFPTAGATLSINSVPVAACAGKEIKVSYPVVRTVNSF